MSDAEIGSLLIRLQASTAELDQQIKATRDHFVDLHDTIGTVKDALAAFGVFEGIKSVVEATADAQKAQALLASQLKATGDASGYNLQQLEAMAQGFADKSTQSRESIEQIEAELLAFRNIAGTQFQGAVQAVLNFSAVTGRDATQAVRALGIALNDPVNGMQGLKRAGIDLSDGLKFTIKSMAEQGDLIGAQNILLHQMELSYGGAAEAARNTLGGALQGLKHDFNDLLQGDGTGVQGLTDSINELDKILKDPDVKQGLATLTAGVLTLAGAAAKAASIFADLGVRIGEAFAMATGATGNFDDQLRDLRGHIQQTQDDITGLEAGGTPKDAPAIVQLQRQLAEYQYHLKDTLLYQQALTGKSTLDPTVVATASPNYEDLGQIDNSHSEHVPNAIQPISDLEQQRKVIELWKQMDPAAFIKEQIEEIDGLVGTVVNGQAFTQQMADTRISQLEEEWKRHTDAMVEATQTAAQSMQQDLQQFFFDPINEGLGGLLKAFMNTLREMLAQWAAAQVFNSFFGSYDRTGQGSGTAGFGDLMANFFGGHRAGGGPVSAGTMYQVNENGIEGFRPNTGGSIVPLAGGGNSSGMGGGDINVSYHIDARGADGASAAQFLQVLPGLRRLVHSDIEYRFSRGAWPA